MPEDTEPDDTSILFVLSILFAPTLHIPLSIDHVFVRC